MEVWQTINAIVNGAIIGVLVYDWSIRRRLDVGLRDAREELSSAVSKLHTLHEGVSKKLLEIEERVASHDYQLTAKVAPKRQSNPFDTRGK